jgi:hypothetical protein
VDEESKPAKPVPGPVRRLWWLWSALAVAVLAVVAVVVTAAVVGVRSVRAGERSDRAYDTAVHACADLETRLNRLAPPGAARSARQRAAAIRAENGAAAPFLAELDSLRPDWRGRRWTDYMSAWHRLVDARTAYADALDREASGGDTAFFILSRPGSGRSAVDVLLDTDLHDCGGVVRRLARPDL